MGTKVKKIKKKGKGKKKKGAKKTKAAPTWLSNAVSWISWFKKEQEKKSLDEVLSNAIFRPANRIPCNFCNGFVPCQNPKCFANLAYDNKPVLAKKTKKKRKGKGKKKKKK